MRVAPSLKTALRKKLRSARRSLPAAEHQRRSTLAARAILALPGFSSGKRVAVYLPFDRETDTALLLRAARRRGVRLYLPLIIDRLRGRMRFHPHSGRLHRGHFGIEAPLGDSPSVAARWLDLIVIPLVGIDPEGYRLGMGLGFYDRALAFRLRQSRRLGPRLVGLAFDCQRTAESVADPWDIRLDMLATESGLTRFNTYQSNSSKGEP